MKQDNRLTYFLLWSFWTSAIVYGSLIPFELRDRTLEEAINLFVNIQYLDLGVVSRADWIANILLYIPFGYVTAAMFEAFIGRKSNFSTIPITLILATTLIVGVEFIQLFFAPRTVSQNHLIKESMGTTLGLIIWHYNHHQLKILVGYIFNAEQRSLNTTLIKKHSPWLMV